ncbi:unnamed protein product [Scytosiphon promiscuus]
MASGRPSDTVSMVGSVSLAEQQQQQQLAKAAPSLVCVECGRPVALLFREYNKGNIRLGRCSYCRSVADKYIECEFVLIAIDLALHRVQAYRHLLFNMRPFSTHSFHGRLWQLGVAMAALDAHLRHTALSSEAAAAQEISGSVPVADSSSGAGDPFWEAGGLLLAAVIEHACFAAGAVLCASSRVRSSAAAAAAAAKARRNRTRHAGGRRNRQRSQDGSQAAGGGIDHGGGDSGTAYRGGGAEDNDDEWRSSPDFGRSRDARAGGKQQARRQYGGPGDDAADDEEEEDPEDDDGYESSSSYSLPPPRPDLAGAAAASSPSLAEVATSPGGSIGVGVPRATKMYMAVVYPLFFRLLAAFVMIWDRQVAILNTIELLVATMQFVALSAVVGGPAAVSGMGEGGVAAMAVVAGLASKMGARAVLCFWFGSDPRTLRML